LILGVGSSGDRAFAVVAYTSTRTSFEGTRRPRQHLLIDETRAIALGQSKSFIVDVSRIARLPVIVEYFPDLLDEAAPSFGRDPALVTAVAGRIRELIADGFAVTPVDLTSMK
jgi:hypothetical protein